MAAPSLLRRWLPLALLLVGMAPAASAPAVRAQPTPYTVDVWTTEDGLPQNFVYAAAQTPDGYLWIGTGSGLARFDGHSFTVFDRANTPVLESNAVHALRALPDGRLWIMLRANIVVYEDGRFTDHTPPMGQDGRSFTELLVDESGRPWLEHHPHVTRLSLPLSESILLDSLPHAPRPYAAGQRVVPNLHPRRWVLTIQGDRPQRISVPPDQTPTRGRAFTTRDSTLWLVNENELVRYRDGQRTRLPNPHPPDLVFFHEMADGTFWLGNPKGLHRWTGTGFVNEYPLTTSVMFFFEDREGNLWFGSQGDGLFRMRAATKFATHTPREGLPHALTWTVYEDPAAPGTRWVGTDGGLTRFDAEGRITTFTTADGLPNNRVFSILRDRAGTLWVGTNQGLARQNGSRFVTLDGTSVRGAIFEDRDGTLWVGTSFGLMRYRDGQRDVVQIDTERYGLFPLRVRHIHQTPDGTLWFGTETRGLLRYRDGHFAFLGPEDGIDYPFVQTFFEEPDGTLWIGTRGGGLVRYRDERFVTLSTQHGLFDGTIHNLLDDGLGFFWMSTNRGIFRVRKQDLHAVADGTAAFVTSVVYGTADGLRSVECNTGTPGAIRTADGRLWFPTIQGLAVVDPANLRHNDVPPPVIIEAVLADYAPVPLTPHLALAAGTRGVAFQYTGLSFSAPERVRYRYRLDGFNEAWVDAGAERAAQFTNLPPGPYTFRVQAANNDGVWSPEGAALAFVLEPHFYQTPWFFALALFGLLGIGFVGYRYRVRQIREQELVALVEARTADLRAEQQKTEAQAHRLRELDALKTRFFANLSHEFRTPLTLTLGPLDDLLGGTHGPLAEPVRDRLGMMRRNAHRLLDLINQLLDVAKLEAGKMTLHAREADLVAFVRERVLLFGSLAERKQITLTFAADDPPPPIYFDADKLEKVVYNLLSNALKFTPPHGRVGVMVGTDAGAALLTVRDTGAGIPADQLAHVFDRFYQAEDRQQPASTGIGLALAKELVERHGGTLTVESDYGFGTTFTVRLPLGRAHLDVGDVAAFGEGEEGGESGEEGKAARDFSDGLPPEPSNLQPSNPQSHIPDATILVVEDNAEVRAYVAEGLAAHFSVIEAEDGITGLDCAREAVPDLVVSDVMMPGMDGFALCRALKTDERTSHIPVILLTARADAESRLEGLEHGADAYLAKPFDARELRLRVDNLIETRRRLRARFSRAVRLEPAAVAVTSADEAFLQRAIAAVEAHMADGGFGVYELADALGLSRRQLHRKLTALTGETPNAFIRHLRLHRGKHLLEQGYGTIAEVAYASGFNKPSYFAEQFRKTFGTAPSEWDGGG